LIKTNLWASFTDAQFLAEQKNFARDIHEHIDDIDGIEIIVAGGDKTRFYSRFGHGLLRLKRKNGQFQNDYLISFLANQDESKIEYIDGITGKYGVFPYTDTFGKFWNEYTLNENRPLYRYIISTNSEKRKKIIQTLLNWIENPAIIGSYTFLNNNCAGIVVNLLIESGFSYPIGMKTRIPTNLGDYLNAGWISPYPALVMQNFNDVKNKLLTSLRTSPDETFNDLSLWQNKDAVAIIEKNFSEFEILKILINFKNLMPNNIRLNLLKNHNFRNSKIKLEDVLEYKEAPLTLYQLCKDDECAKNLVLKLESVFDKLTLRNSYLKNDFYFHAGFKINSEEDQMILTNEDQYLLTLDSIKRDRDTFISYLKFIKVIRSQNLMPIN
jgi:hypothetical protein